jgi:hypothetical protein
MLSKSISQEVELRRSMDLPKSITSGSRATLLQKTSLEGFAVSENGEGLPAPLSLDQLEKEALS